MKSSSPDRVVVPGGTANDGSPSTSVTRLGAPRSLGVDEHGREILSYLPSEPVWAYAEPVIAAMALLLRRLHDALDTFTAPAGSVWRHEIDHGVDLRMGHNDIGPQNIVFAGGLPYGFVDWELAGPVPRCTSSPMRPSTSRRCAPTSSAGWLAASARSARSRSAAAFRAS